MGPPDAPLQLARVTVTGCTQPTLLRVDGDGLRGEAVAEPGREVVEIPVAVERPVVGERRAARVHAAGTGAPPSNSTSSSRWPSPAGRCSWSATSTTTRSGGTRRAPTPASGPRTRRARTADQRLRAGARAPGNGPPRARLQVRARRGGLPQALLGHAPGGPRRPAPVHRRGPPRGDGRHLQRAQHQPHQPRDDHPEHGARHGFSARRAGRRPGHGVATGRVRSRSAIPGDGRRRRTDVQFLGPRPAPPVGSDPGRSRSTACSSAASSSGSRRPGRGLLTHYMPAHYAAGWWMDSRRRSPRRGRRPIELFGQLKKVALTRNVLLPVGTDYTPPNKWVTAIHRDWAARYTWPRFVCALPKEFFAAVRAELVERGQLAVAANPRHEPDLHRQGRLLHRHQAGQPRRGERRTGGRALRRFRRADDRRRLPAGRAGQGVGATGVRGAPRRHHRLGVRSGLPRPADRVARRLGAGPRGPRQLACGVVRGRGYSGPATSSCGTRCRTGAPTSSPSGSIGRPARGCGCSTTPATRCPHSSSTAAARSPGWRATCRRWAGGPTGWCPLRLNRPTGWAPVPGTRIANEHYRIRVDPARGGGVASP